MVEQLSMAGAWFLSALIFLYINLKISRKSYFTFISFVLLWTSCALALFFLALVSLEVLNG